MQVLGSELFWKNLDTSALLVKAIKSQLDNGLKIKTAYELLVNTIP